MKHTFPFLLLAIAALVPQQGKAQDQDRVAIVYGVLRDDATRAPIPGGAVTLTTNSGRQIVTAPVSAGSVSVRIALSIALMSCSGRLMRSQ